MADGVDNPSARTTRRGFGVGLSNRAFAAASVGLSSAIFATALLLAIGEGFAGLETIVVDTILATIP